MEFADSFVYLGSTVTNNGDPKPEIERRRALSSNVMQALRNPLRRQQSISRTTKMRIYCTMQQSCLWCCTARRPGLSLEPSPPGLTALTVGVSDRFLAFTGATTSPVKRCGSLPDSPRPPLWLPAAGSAGMDMCFACHRTILLGLSWTSTLARSAGSNPEELHVPAGLTW